MNLQRRRQHPHHAADVAPCGGVVSMLVNSAPLPGDSRPAVMSAQSRSVLATHVRLDYARRQAGQGQAGGAWGYPHRALRPAS